MNSLKVLRNLSLIMSLFLISCGSAQFRNQSPAFSITYPAYWTKSKSPVSGSVFFAKDNYGLPWVNVLIRDKPRELDLDSMPVKTINLYKERFPKSSDHKILKEEMITLKDGTRAMAYMIKWLYEDKATTLITTCVVTFKDNKQITVVTTTKQGMSTDICEQITHSLEFEQKKNMQPKITGDSMRVAVMDFRANGVSQLIASNISELIQNDLIMMGNFIVLERSQVDQILKEQGFQMTGCTETSCAVKVGQMLSAKKIVIGTVMKMGNKIVISGRLVDVEKGIGERAATQNASTIDELDEATGKFTRMLTGN